MTETPSEFVKRCRESEARFPSTHQDEIVLTACVIIEALVAEVGRLKYAISICPKCVGIQRNDYTEAK